jgi:alkylation response protein AidB-like acyl-CoA dehydrogenase
MNSAKTLLPQIYAVAAEIKQLMSYSPRSPPAENWRLSHSRNRRRVPAWARCGQRPTLHSAMSKCFASDVAMRVTIDALQILGGYGYMHDYPLEKYMRGAKITQICEGTNQIHREEMSKTLISGFHSRRPTAAAIVLFTRHACEILLAMELLARSPLILKKLGW